VAIPRDIGLGSENERGKWSAAASPRCIMVQGKGGIALSARCRAGVRDEPG
jgi:hypothetical protein